MKAYDYKGKGSNLPKFKTFGIKLTVSHKLSYNQLSGLLWLAYTATHEVTLSQGMSIKTLRMNSNLRQN